jgi:hypothetical protein
VCLQREIITNTKVGQEELECQQMELWDEKEGMIRGLKVLAACMVTTDNRAKRR